MPKLQNNILSTDMKIIELYNKYMAGSLDLQPHYQRKLVWKKQHKYNFIKTILDNYPFPEIYIASAAIDVKSLKALEWVVDGQQRLSTIFEYIDSRSDFEESSSIPFFKDLSDDEKKSFLNYTVSVRDLKDISHEIISDIFQRINLTEYSLNGIERINAQYGDSEFMLYCKQLVEMDFVPNSNITNYMLPTEVREKFDNFFHNDNNIFSDNDIKRMNNLHFAMTLVATLFSGEYFRRNDNVKEFLEKYNDEVENVVDFTKHLLYTIDIISQLNLPQKSYWLNKANIFTLICEIFKYGISSIDKLRDNLIMLEEQYKKYLHNKETEEVEAKHKLYFENAREAVNEKSSREYRGKIIKEFLV